MSLKDFYAMHYSMLAFVGSDTKPTHKGEYIFQIVSMGIGVFLIAAIVGSASSVLLSMDATQERRKQHSDQMHSFMKRNGFSKVRTVEF
jgi:hypothetical protein